MHVICIHACIYTSLIPSQAQAQLLLLDVRRNALRKHDVIYIKCSTSHVSASPATMNNLLNLLTDPVQPAHHCYQPVQSNRLFGKCALQKAAQCQLSTFLSINCTFLEQCSIA